MAFANPLHNRLKLLVVICVVSSLCFADLPTESTNPKIIPKVKWYKDPANGIWWTQQMTLYPYGSTDRTPPTYTTSGYGVSSANASSIPLCPPATCGLLVCPIVALYPNPADDAKNLYLRNFMAYPQLTNKNNTYTVTVYGWVTAATSAGGSGSMQYVMVVQCTIYCQPYVGNNWAVNNGVCIQGNEIGTYPG